MQEIFIYNNKKYPKTPTMTEFMELLNLPSSASSKIRIAMEKSGINTFFELYTLTYNDIQEMLNGNTKYSKLIFDMIQIIKHQGNIIKSGNELEKIEKSYRYLKLSEDLNIMLTYSNGMQGLRSQSLIEIYGPAGVGKTQLCLSIAVWLMRPKPYGWNASVAYIDSEGGFEYSRFLNLARYWGLEQSFIDNKIHVSKVNTFDEVELVIDKLSAMILKKNIGIIILDSIIDPLRSQYPIGDDLSTLQPRQKHLKRVTDKLKNLALMYNIIVVYTNQVRADMQGGIIPQGGNVLSHASDIRISLQNIDNKELSNLGIKETIAEVVDCGFLPRLKGKFLITSMGVMDKFDMDLVKSHTLKILEHGYMCVNYMGEIIDRQK